MKRDEERETKRKRKTNLTVCFSCRLLSIKTLQSSTSSLRLPRSRRASLVVESHNSLSSSTPLTEARTSATVSREIQPIFAESPAVLSHSGMPKSPRHTPLDVTVSTPASTFLSRNMTFAANKNQTSSPVTLTVSSDVISASPSTPAPSYSKFKGFSTRFGSLFIVSSLSFSLSFFFLLSLSHSPLRRLHDVCGSTGLLTFPQEKPRKTERSGE